MKQNRTLFHTSDLALLWAITDQNTLYTAISRYIKKGILTSIHKGFYATRPIAVLDPLELGVSYLHTYAYISCEYVLVKEGAIFQNPSAITLVSSISKSFNIGPFHFRSRKLKDEYLYRQAGIVKRGNVLIASLERALADMLYFNPRHHIDKRDLINWDQVKTIQRKKTCYL